MHATSEGTQQYFQRFPIHEQKRRLFSHLSVSALGSGTYLGKVDDETDRLYEQTLFKAGLNGINFFDTAIHYRCMRSEKVLRKVLKDLAEQEIGREQVVVATKGGILSSEGSPEEAEEYSRIHYFDSGLIRKDQVVAGYHCIAPAYLEQQIAKSLENLGLDCIDLYYLHNPDIQLQEIEEEEFYRRLTQAFTLLEEQVKKRKICFYGISTWNGFCQKTHLKGTLQLERVLACAQEAAGGEPHHLKAVQIPYNLIMLEAIKLKNQVLKEEQKTLWQVLVENNISWMVSAPLMQSQVASLSARVYERLPVEESFLLQALQFVSSTPHVCTTFVGMKQLAHLLENQKILSLPDWIASDWMKASSSIGAPVIL